MRLGSPPSGGLGGLSPLFFVRKKKGAEKASAPNPASQRQAGRPDRATDARRQHGKPTTSARPPSKPNKSPQGAGRSRPQRSRPPPTASRPKPPQKPSGSRPRRASPPNDQRRRPKRQPNNKHSEHPQKTEEKNDRPARGQRPKRRGGGGRKAARSAPLCGRAPCAPDGFPADNGSAARG